MSSLHNNAALRKGTNSCTECRRRKVRCVRLFEGSASCRQCEERGSACMAQTSAHRPSRTPRLPSRYRISQLESQVSQLTRIVHSLESKIGGQPTHINRTPGDDKSDDVQDDSGAESSASEVLMADQPSHLRSLFQNEWLSVDTRRDETQLQERRKKDSDLLELARPRLQSLIPSREEVSEITSFAYDWLTIFQAILPQPFTVESRQEVLDRYEEMCRPDVDVIDLALWLLTIAITAQQIPQGPMSPEVQFQMYRNHIELCRQIINTVEDTLLCHDRLLGTVKGLGMVVHILRLRIGQGSFQKGWIRLRHAIALAELMGLPKLYKAVKLNRLSEVDAMSQHAAQLWELICNVDRLFGMILNLPPATRRYQLTVTDPLVTDGIVNTRVYLCKLLDIAARVYDMDDSLTHGSGGSLHLELAGELSALASQTPRSWWARGPDVNAQPEDFLQFMHHSIAMRIHLPLALRQDSGAGHMYNRLACTDACDSIVKKYEYLIQTLPPGFFVSKMLDLHAFIAAVVLLLTSHNSPADRHSFRIDSSRLQGVAMRVADLMGERSQMKPGSDLAREGHNTLCALNRLLQQDDSTIRDQDLTLKVPLLGKVHIRRNARQSSSVDQLPSQTTIRPGIGADNTRSQEHMLTPSSYQAPLDNSTDTSMLNTEVSPDQSQWNGLSWSIEESYENFFDNSAMGQDLGESPLWWDIANPDVFPA
ncbi:hypothetical protein P168DRAFT_252931 [Aspergillus campestris IBT 28561]|uniref:Zn(2)-C6 fungal-type domain-containing protein n=1 Tax=Aspergillus campestris (strain IBT 28561) TaxID=1392248 RepID=A0A2I1D2K9_ASPC2|nr:uncharacterized protein P168DRAFT_252931 [Aspergillus campestris IBT 28561]PKY04122.1 hypothetical protein P168DRAFT_252931 [Aspergillus campestris IBT 28561]